MNKSVCSNMKTKRCRWSLVSPRKRLHTCRRHEQKGLVLGTLPSLGLVVIIAWMRCDKNPLWLSYCYTNEVMRKHYVCRHSNLHGQTSHFHLYVNAPYVNKLCSTWGGAQRWAYAHHLDLVHLTTYWLSKFDNRQMIGNFQQISFIFWKQAERFWTLIWLDGRGSGQSKRFLTTMKLKWCVFLTYLLFCCCTDAAFIHSNFNLVLEDSINLCGCLQYKGDKKRWVVWKNPRWWHILCGYTTLARNECRTC